MDQGNMSPMGMMKPKKSGSTGVIILIVVIVVLLVAYLSMRSKSTDMLAPETNQPQTTTDTGAVTQAEEPTVPADISAEATTGFSESNDLGSIEKDLKASSTNTN